MNHQIKSPTGPGQGIKQDVATNHDHTIPKPGQVVNEDDSSTAHVDLLEVAYFKAAQRCGDVGHEIFQLEHKLCGLYATQTAICEEMARLSRLAREAGRFEG